MLCRHKIAVDGHTTSRGDWLKICVAAWYKRRRKPPNSAFCFGTADQTCQGLGMQAALDQSKKDSAKMQGWLAVFSLTWAAQYNTWLLIKLAPQGVVVYFVSFLSV